MAFGNLHIAHHDAQVPHQMVSYDMNVRGFPIAAGAAMRIAAIPTELAKVVLTADASNSVPIFIGDRTLKLTGGIPNACLTLLNAGSVGIIWVDDPRHEYFDLGLYFAIHNAAVTQNLFITYYTIRPM